MFARQLLFGLIMGIFVCHPQGISGQIIRNVPRFGSVSKADSTAYKKNVGLGALELSRGVSSSRSVTKSNGDVFNGGTTSVSRSKAKTRGVNLGGVNIGSTLTRTHTNTNGEVSRGLAHDFNVGNLGFGSSISRNNLKNGFGLQRSADGRASVGLGLLNLDFTHNAQQSNAITMAQANAQGENAHARASGNSQSNARQFGLIGVTETRSHSNAESQTKFGQTSANTSGFGGGFRRPRRDLPEATHGSIPFAARRINRTRSKRQAQFIPFQYSEVQHQRTSRHSAVLHESNHQISFSKANSRPNFQGVNGLNSAAKTSSRTNSVQDPGFVSNWASSNASASTLASSDFDAGDGFSSTNAQASASDSRGAGSVFQDNSGAALKQSTRRRAVHQSRLYSYALQHLPQQPLPHPMLAATVGSSILINRQNRTSAQQLPSVMHQSETELVDLRQPRHLEMSLSRNHKAADENNQLAVASINRTTEQFDSVDENQRQGRTFNLITDFINRMFGCVYPCTIDALRDNRCCPPPPPPPCCQPPIRPPIMPPPIPPPHPPLFPPIPQPPPIHCCVRCYEFGFYGPPPCYRFGYGRTGTLINSFSNYPVGFRRTSASMQRDATSSGTRVTVYVPPPSTLYISAEDM